MRKLVLGLAALGGLTLVSATQANANMLQNGSFETGNFSGWTTFGYVGYSGVYSGPFDVVVGDNGPAPQAGNYAAYLGTYIGDGGATNGLSQTITDTPGQTLLVTGYYAGYPSAGYLSSLEITFGSDVLVDLTPGPSDHSGWTEFSAEVIGTGSDTLTITNQQQDFYNLIDDFSITAVTTVPEPNTMMIMLAGIMGLAIAGYSTSRRRRV